MKILVVGGGGREHALIRRLRQSPAVTEIFCCPGNGGIACDATCTDIRATDLDAIVQYAVEQRMDYVVVAPDDPLAMGLVDRLAEHGIPAFGPTAAAARIESSKIFAKNLMKKYGIPTARYGVFDDYAGAASFIQSQTRFPLVVKADGLALGKGVLICEDADAALRAARSMLEEGAFGKSGSRIVVEEFLTGPEVSVLCFTDGVTLRPMVSSMDHKRALDGDEGLNTGGMGTVAPNPFYTKDVAARCIREIFLPTIQAMNAEGCPFRGCLYFGLMLTPDGPKVIEYNCRFGDPETQVVLPLLEGDLFEIMRATTEGRLAHVHFGIRSGAAACVVIASGGYPEAYEKGKEIHGLDAHGQVAGATVYHAGTALQNGRFFTAGGRVLGVTATADTLREALDRAYKAADAIDFDGAHRRRDIGKRALSAQ